MINNNRTFDIDMRTPDRNEISNAYDGYLADRIRRRRLDINDDKTASEAYMTIEEAKEASRKAKAPIFAMWL